VNENEPAQSETQSELSNLSRPDPAFKREMQEAAAETGLKLREVEFPQIFRADIVLEVPDDADLSGTMFNFFGKYNIIEFKSENDRFNWRKYLVNEVRTDLFLIQNETLEINEVLTVYILAKYPREFFRYMVKHGFSFQQDKVHEWLYRAKTGGKDVVIVVCSELPLAKTYYRWLLFASSTTQKWHDFVKMIAREQELDLLERARNMRPKEFKLMASEILDILKQYPPKRQAKHRRDMLDLIKTELALYAKDDPECRFNFSC
jgi:hypothetical protein